MRKTLPTIAILEQLFECDADEGILIWRPRPREMFGSNMNFHRWNKAYAGTQAGRVTAAGYRSVKVYGEAFQAHRIIWKITTKEEPGEIDHINRDKLDNRISNLRVVSRSVNMKNKGLTSNNTSGHKHIVWTPRTKRWTVQMSVSGKGQRQLAWCKTMEEAVEARNRIYQELGYYK